MYNRVASMGELLWDSNFDINVSIQLARGSTVSLACSTPTPARGGDSALNPG